MLMVNIYLFLVLIMFTSEINGVKDDVFPANCGECTVSVSTVIVGGEEVRPPHSLPWQGALYERNKFQCGASIIADQWVLCAAHCVKDKTVSLAKNLKVLLGAHNMSAKGDGKLYNVSAVFVHGEFNGDTLYNDVSLLKLEKAIEFKKTGGKIAPVCVADKSLRYLEKDTNVIVSGWGTLRSDDYESSDVLKKVVVPIVAQGECRRAYSGKEISEGMICAGLKKGGKDSCQGDSGGPMVLRQKGKTPKEDKCFQVGVVSWGDGCAAKDAYGVYTRVAVYRDWIKRILTKHKNN